MKKESVILAAALVLLSQGAAWAQAPLDTLRSTTTNAGLYSNRIASITPPAAYTEICFEAGSILFDLHPVPEPTSGGNCRPGDVGWIIEQDERNSMRWADARAECLLDGMRLPEPFEWSISCNSESTFGLNGMTNGLEWTSNQAFPTRNGNDPDNDFPDRIQVPVMGDGDCAEGSGFRANFAGLRYRCVR